MYSKILIPLDGSRLAEQALPCALEVARRTHAAVTLLRIVPPIRENEVGENGYVIFVDQLMEMAQRDAREYLNAIAQPLHDEGLRVTTAIQTGLPADSILDYAQSMGIDLIAMSTHGRSGIGRWVFGSVADRVLRGSTCPVLLTRADAATFAGAPCVSRILVPLDGSPLAEGVLPYATTLAQLFGAELLLMRVAMTPTTVQAFPETIPLLVSEAQAHEREVGDYLAQCLARVQQAGVRVRTLSAKSPVGQSILAVADAEQVSLIAMSTHGRGGVRRWVYGSVADRVLHTSAVPILLVRAVPNTSDILDVAAENLFAGKLN